uniref:Protein kinase domain-containing protein n=1 Tax=Davidia involucrata TaxID=16924 RepID=A0A5B6ZHY1_DAVIN
MAAVRLLITSHLLLFSLISLSLSPLSLSIPDNEALLKFKKSLTIHGDILDSWVPNTSPCNTSASWAGVLCSRGIVIGIRLAQLKLSGTVDIDALRELPRLRAISLDKNSFSGPIPEFSRLGALKSLYLIGNQFSGEIPKDFFSKMLSLKKLWLSGNKFSGRIPESLTRVPNLIQLHLEYNEFSGPIPSLGQASLMSMDISYNKLEGEIPASMAKFDIRSYEGNSGLCGKPLNKECKKLSPTSSNSSSLLANNTADASPEENQKPVHDKSKGGWVIFGLMVAVLSLTLLFKMKHKGDRFNVLSKENFDDDVVEVHIPSSNRRGMEPSNRSSRKGSGSSRKGPQHGKSMGDLVVVNEEKGIFGLPDLMKAGAEVLGNGGLGSAYKAVMANRVSVVVKRMREMNKLSVDEFDTEIRRLGRLQHQNVLTPLAYHYRKEEKLLVSEYVPRGSLLYIMHGDRGISHAQLNWPTRLKIIQGIACGMGFLHSEFASYELPHGNLKSSNVLLDSNYKPLLSDYAFYPLINNPNASQAMFAFKSPEGILYQQVSPKSDVYCLGIIILEILTGKFPSQYLNNQKGGTDVVQWVRSAVSEKRETELIDPEIASATNSVEQMEKLLRIGAYCTEGNPDQRIDMKEAIRRIEEIKVV